MSAPTSPAEPPAVRLADPAALVAALPVILGFRPHDSLVLAALGAGAGPGSDGDQGRPLRSTLRLGLTLRVDLPPPRHVDDVCAMAADNLLLGDPEAAAVVVVGGADGSRRGRPARRGRAATDPPRRDVGTAAVEALRARGVPVRTAVWAARCAGGARWACYDGCGCGGLVPDPGGTALAALAVTEGQVLYGGRAELERLVAPVDAAVLRRREELLVRGLGADGAAEPVLGAAAGSALLERVVTDAADGRLALDDAAVVALAQALALPEVRDEALRHCAGSHAAAAEQLWAALARETPDPEAAVPAALLALAALLRGSGGLANVALDRAERAWPGHRLTGLLRATAAAGARPDEVRAWLG
ncbi:MAG: DUF4192 domain-containing protein [Pseudonocardia sp.]